MIVQGGNTFLNNQSTSKKGQEKSSSSDGQSFDNMLTEAHRKKKPMSAKKTVSPKKKAKTDDIADQEQEVTQRQNPIKKKIHEQRKPIVEASSQLQKLSQNVLKVDKSISLEEQSTEQDHALTQNLDLKNLPEDKNQVKKLVSLNPSELTKETLEKNEKNVMDLQNSFESLMAKSQIQNTKGVQKGIGQAMTNLTGGKMKLDPAMKLNENMETLNVDMGQALEGVKLESRGQEASSDQGMDLNNLISHYMDQDLNVQEVESGAFAEELNKIGAEMKTAKPENVNNIVQQAKTIIDDGGGSMEIHLQPEGLGKVQLKVAVENGQVNVEMMADNALAKKALEEGLGDIKSALEGQKLLVETLKVEMSQDYQKDFTDLQQHMQEQANRDFAEDFLGQFRQEREGRFSGMFDSFRNFQPGQNEPDLTLSNRNPYAENGKGRTLNLIA